MAELNLAGLTFDGMPFCAGWSGSKTRLQSKPIRCELMIDVAAIITRLLKVTEEGGKPGG